MAVRDSEMNKVIGECLKAVVDGPFLPDWEFHALMGLNVDEVRSIALAWPNVNSEDDDVKLAINNAMANLLGYPIGRADRWSEFISVPPDKLREIFEAWRTCA